MNTYQTLSILVSILAVIVSVVALIRTRSISAKQLELEKITAELSKKQLEQINNAEIAQTMARIDLELQSEGQNYRLYVVNVGLAEAVNVNLKIDNEYNPLLPDEYKEKFPIHILRPGKNVSLFLVDEMGAPSKYEIDLTWQNPDGSQKEDKQVIHLN